MDTPVVVEVISTLLLETKQNVSSCYIFQGKMGDLWRFDLIDGKWYLVSGTLDRDCAPVHGTKGVQRQSGWGCRQGHSMHFDSGNKSLILFGGEGTSGRYNDLWTFQIDSQKWTWASGDSSPEANEAVGQLRVFNAQNQPQSRAHFSSVFDEEGSLLSVYGGRSYNGSYHAVH